MKILIVDRDAVVKKLIKLHLEPLGYEVIEEENKAKAAELAQSEKFNIIFFNPAPLKDARSPIMQMRRVSSNYPYIIQLTKQGDIVEAMKCGANDFLDKPIDTQALEDKTYNAKFISALIRRIGDTREDFPSAGGIISKSAFNQLFLSAMDRSDRYGERTFIVFISVSNYQDIYEREGPYAADYAAAKLSKYLVYLRRQSDIIAQTATYEFALLLQRPLYDTEPKDAANRFIEALAKTKDLFDSGEVPPKINVKLIDLPVGQRIIDQYLTRETIAS